MRYNRTLLLLLVIFCLFTSFLCRAQTEETAIVFPAGYVTKTDIGVANCNIIGQKTALDGSIDGGTFTDSDFVKTILPQGVKFSVVGKKDENYYIIKVWIFNYQEQARPLIQKLNFNADINTKDTFNSTVANPTEKRRYFLIKTDDLRVKATRLFTTTPVFTIGAIVIPVKMRFSPFDFSKDFSLGAVGGLRLRIAKRSDNFFNALAGVGIADITLDSSTTGNKTTIPIDKPALTACFGFAFEFGKAQVGIFTGWDLISKKNVDESGWSYQKTPWLSIGLGLQIFSSNTQSKNNKEGTNFYRTFTKRKGQGGASVK